MKSKKQSFHGNHKILIIILLALIITSALVVWKFLINDSSYIKKDTTESTQPETSNRESYINNEYGFSFDIPNEWSSSEDVFVNYPPNTVDENTPVILHNGVFYATDENDARIYVTVWKKGHFYPVPPFEQITLGGLPAIRGNNYVDARMGHTNSVSVTKGDYQYQIELQVSDPDRIEFYESRFNTVLNSFRFIQ